MQFCALIPIWWKTHAKKKKSLLLLAIALLLHIPHVLHTFIMPNEFLLTSGIYTERDFRKGLSNFILFILFAPNTTEHSKHILFLFHNIVCVVDRPRTKKTHRYLLVLFSLFQSCFEHVINDMLILLLMTKEPTFYLITSDILRQK